MPCSDASNATVWSRRGLSQAAPTRFASTWPSSATRYWETRSTESERGEVASCGACRDRCSTPRRFASGIRTQAGRLWSVPPFPRTCRSSWKGGGAAAAARRTGQEISRGREPSEGKEARIKSEKRNGAGETLSGAILVPLVGTHLSVYGRLILKLSILRS